MPVRRLADKVGLTDALGAALVRRGFRPVHDRGTVLVSAACAVLLGARSMAGIDVMRQTSLVLGRPASASTLWRTLVSAYNLMWPVAYKLMCPPWWAGRGRPTADGAGRRPPSRAPFGRR